MRKDLIDFETQMQLDMELKGLNFDLDFKLDEDRIRCPTFSSDKFCDCQISLDDIS